MEYTRRAMLRILAGLPLAGTAFADNESLIGRLIEQARVLPRVAERIGVISGGLLGARYQANTLIGGPATPEVFVVRDDAFDCVTFCEVVLAAAHAFDLAEFEASLRHIRYRRGKVQWEERNHYFADWCRRAVENRFCRPVVMRPSVRIEKTVNWGNLGPRSVSFTAIPRATLAASRKLLASGDVIGFASRRPDLDFHHTGLITFGTRGRLMLRHASQTLGRVVDEPLDAFVTRDRTQYVTLVRPAEAPHWPLAPDEYLAAVPPDAPLPG